MFCNITEPQPVATSREKYSEKTSENVWRERDKTSIFASAFRKGGGFEKRAFFETDDIANKAAVQGNPLRIRKETKGGIDKEDTSDRQYILMIDYGKGVLGLKGGLLEEINKKQFYNEEFDPGSG